MLARILRAAADRLSQFHSRFARLFGRIEAQEHSRTYLQGLLLAEGHKSIEPIALRFAQPKNNEPVSQNQVLALQGFVTDSPWESSAVQKEIQAVFAEEFVPSTTGSALGTVGVIDESSFEKSGPHSVGTKRQYCGRLGKTENCQVGVFLVGSTPAGDALLDHQLYLPQEWATDAKRRKKARFWTRWKSRASATWSKCQATRRFGVWIRRPKFRRGVRLQAGHRRGRRGSTLLLLPNWPPVCLSKPGSRSSCARARTGLWCMSMRAVDSGPYGTANQDLPSGWYFSGRRIIRMRSSTGCRMLTKRHLW